MRPPNPNCPNCHGSGEIEHVVNYTWQGKPAILFEYSPCACAYTRPETEEEEDWSRENPSIHSS